ncbi:glucans biosynthesis glucosyltransferase MdoH [Gemmobacter lutimaris]|uniref:Glucans biosynthesis glucosyltransferase H n=1 Tax=Gemmobacter lutimaris TaxID=2306023 RepID=A0A398BHP8_9RHOB|nr:glucans biosynthesis glucosyltransferase MdoH [Gemmobacter lutimaris]RID90035.1 glucans biosynthesis glucosyltransferase MdoH [Gemmobacter lutimaris]
MPGPAGHVGASLPRAVAVTLSLVAGAGAFMLFLQFGMSDGLDAIDIARSVLIFISTWWLAWGAVQGLMGLTTQAEPPALPEGPLTAKVAVLVPVYNEDPVTTFSRVAAMDESLQATGLGHLFHIAILSDSRNEAIAARERLWFLRLVGDRAAEGRIFYRRRTDNRGKKAGNVEDFIQKSGGAYDFALILDADSLMEGATIVEMARRMQATPDLGLLQTLPVVTRAGTRFGRAMQFSAAFHSPVFARGLAMMQGRTGPFWGHNAMVRVHAFAESCGLPELRGKPPFGGHVMSHDYVEAALLARAGWRVRLDDDLAGSYEEGPENIVDHAKRDRRWCQGNLQHSRLLLAPGLKPWSRFVFFQGIMAYISPLFWIGFMVASVLAPHFAPPPDYFPEPYWPFPIFPQAETSKAIGLAIGVFGLLILPKFAIALHASMSGRARSFGGAARVFASVFAELLFSSLTAPVLLAWQTRSVFQVFLGRDGGWPTNNRGAATLSLGDAWAASHWIVMTGAVALAGTWAMAPGLVVWMLPVILPMLVAPLLLSWSSRPSRSGLFVTPTDLAEPPVMRRQREILAIWEGEAALPGAPLVGTEPSHASA